MAWLILIAAAVFEVVMAMALKFADGWTRPVASVIGLVAALGSVILLTLAVKELPVSTAYAVWTGLGAVGVCLIGIVMFGDSAHPLRLTCIAAICAGMVGLHLVEGKV